MCARMASSSFVLINFFFFAELPRSAPLLGWRIRFVVRSGYTRHIRLSCGRSSSTRATRINTSSPAARTVGCCTGTPTPDGCKGPPPSLWCQRIPTIWPSTTCSVTTRPAWGSTPSIAMYARPPRLRLFAPQCCPIHLRLRARLRLPRLKLLHRWMRCRFGIGSCTGRVACMRHRQSGTCDRCKAACLPACPSCTHAHRDTRRATRN